jgi:hypothetical protein
LPNQLAVKLAVANKHKITHTITSLTITCSSLTPSTHRMIHCCS